MVARKIAKRGTVKSPKKKIAPKHLEKAATKKPKKRQKKSAPRKSQKKAAPRMKKTKEPVAMQQLFRKPQGHLFDKSLEEARQARESAPVECLGMSFPNDDARREYFLEKLEEKLKDPDFRKTEGFPVGEDADILTLSDPPYYTACPNPFLSEFIRQHARPYSTELDSYRSEPFAWDVSEGKQDPVCMAHTYHTKVPYRAIMRYILHYTSPGDVVLDSFAGTGMTGLAAQLCGTADAETKAAFEGEWRDAGLPDPKWGPRFAVLFDLSPFASFLERNFNSNLSASLFKAEALHLLDSSEASLGWMYETDRADGPGRGTVQYIAWSESVFCECGTEVPFWNPGDLDQALPGIESKSRCPNCDILLSKGSAQRSTITFRDDLLGKTITQNKATPVLVEARFGDVSIRKTPSAFDLNLIRQTTAVPPTQYVPTQPMMFDGTEWGDMYRSGYHRGISHVHHFWTHRNLLILSDLRVRALASPVPFEMMFMLTSFAVKTGSRMHNIGMKDGKLNLAGQIYNTLQIPSVRAERNLYALAKGKVNDLLSVFNIPKTPGSTMISTGSATTLVGLADSTIDYVFIDPPFGENIMYSELSFLYEAWLGVFSKQTAEAIMSGKQSKSIIEYQELMLRAFREAFRVLKPGRWITVAFHNSASAVWNAIQEALGSAGFVVADVRTLDKGQGTFKQMTTVGAVKQDLVITAYKPNGGLERRFSLEAGTEDGVWDFIRTHLRQLPIFVAGAERQSYLLFDRMVAFHVRRGVTVPLSAAGFYSGLAERYPQRDGMYFLPEQVAEYDKKRMTMKEVAQLELFVIDESTAIQWLRQELGKKPHTLQELTPRFMKEAQRAWAKHEKTFELRQLLDDNCVCYGGDGEVPSQIHSYLSTNFKELRSLDKDDPVLRAKAKHRWYVPDPRRAQDLEKLRERALLREFAEYRESKQRRLKVFRTEAVRAGFKAAYDQRDYRIIVDVAAKLPERVLHEDEKLLMYYDVATTRLGG